MLLVEAQGVGRHPRERHFDDPRAEHQPAMFVAGSVHANSHSEVLDHAAQSEKSHDDPGDPVLVQFWARSTGLLDKCCVVASSGMPVSGLGKVGPKKIGVAL
jgi:hypothetical protein